MFERFIQELHLCVSPTQTPVLCYERPDHRPLLPLVRVSTATWNSARRAVPEHAPSLLHHCTYHYVFVFETIWLLPVTYDATHGLIEMVRVVAQSTYDDLPLSPKHCPMTVPLRATVSDTTHTIHTEVVFLDESCFFQVAAPSDALPSATPTRTTKKRKKAT
jgi:hypothetical protein